MASYAENVSIWWRHHVKSRLLCGKSEIIRKGGFDAITMWSREREPFKKPANNNIMKWSMIYLTKSSLWYSRGLQRTMSDTKVIYELSKVRFNSVIGPWEMGYNFLCSCFLNMIDTDVLNYHENGLPSFRTSNTEHWYFIFVSLN